MSVARQPSVMCCVLTSRGSDEKERELSFQGYYQEVHPVGDGGGEAWTP